MTMLRNPILWLFLLFLPAQDAYPATDVVEVFHDPEGPAVRIVSDPSNLRFMATGPAVEAGLVCPAGTTEFTGGWGPPPIRARSCTPHWPAMTEDGGAERPTLSRGLP